MDVFSAERLTRIPPYPLGEVRKRIEAATARGVDVISLAIGDPDQPTPPHIVEALTRAVADPRTHMYPADGHRGVPSFREAVSAWYGRRFGVRTDPATEVMALIGSKEGSHHLALGVLNPGDIAIVPDPGYPAYLASAVMAGAEVIDMPLRRERGFLPDLEEIPEELARRAKLMWLSYPNNPTTAVAPLDFFETAVAFARRYDVLVVNDNPYSEIAYDGVHAHSILEVDGARDVAVEFNSLSKPFNMTGWRIGMAVGNAGAIAAIGHVKENTDTGIFAAIQAAGVAALEGPQDIIGRNIEVYRRRRDLAVRMFRSVGVEMDPPSATFYLWVPIPDGASSHELSVRLLDLTGVVVTAGSSFGAHGEGFIRLSLSVADTRLEEALDRIGGAWDRLSTLRLEPRSGMTFG